jgi:hypothetical protein
VAIILTLNLIVASATARCDSLSISSPVGPGANTIYQTPYRLKPAETALEAVSAWPYGTLMTVFTMVTDAPKAITLPLMVVTAATPGLETVIPG